MAGPPLDVDTVLIDEIANEALREAVPAVLVALLGLATVLGDGAFLVGLAVLCYWFGAPDRERDRLFVIAVGVAAFALTVGLKGLFMAPRPDPSFVTGAHSGYSFPSAHALGSAAVYGAMAVAGRVGTPRFRWTVAGAVIAVVALSRIVLGVHFVGDVIVGVLLGLGLVALGWYAWRDAPGPIFALAIGIIGAATILGSREYTAMATGAALGGLLGWIAIRNRPSTDSGAAILVVALCGLAPVLALRTLAVAVGVPLPVEIVGYAVLTAAVLAVPYVATWIDDWRQVRWLQAVLPFDGRRIRPWH